MTVGGTSAQVLFAGLSPGFVGLAQVNIVLPDSFAIENSAATLVVDFQGEASTAVQLPSAP
ncbi:MAG: hypothetical protein R2724_18695 [Bryobacterales bacterium]